MRRRTDAQQRPLPPISPSQASQTPIEMERDHRTHVCSPNCPSRCLSLTHGARQREADLNWRCKRTFVKGSVATLNPQSPACHHLRFNLKENGATEFALEAWDILREFIIPSPVRLQVHAYQPDCRLPFKHSTNVDSPLDGARRLLKLLDQEPDDILDRKISSTGPQTHASQIHRLKKEGEIKNAARIARLEKEAALIEEGRIVDCWQRKYRQFWYVVMYMASHAPIGDRTTAVLVEILDRLYALCYNHKISCPGHHKHKAGLDQVYCADKISCQPELDNPFKEEKYLWLWERLPECWNTFEFYAPLFRTAADRHPEKNNQGWVLHSNCIPDEAFAAYAPPTDRWSVDEWIRLNAFLARFVRLRGEDKPFVHEGGKPYMVLWLKGLYTMIEAFEVTQAPDGRIFEHQLEDKLKAVLETMSENERANICKHQLRYWVEAQLKASSQVQLQMDNEVLMAALGAACVWIIHGRLTATYLDKNSRILRKDLFAQIEKGNYPGYMNIRWGRHPYATGNLQIYGLLMDWDARYSNWHSRLNQIIDDHSDNESWLFTLARRASTQIMEDWLEAETEYFVHQPVGTLNSEWERVIGHAVELCRTKRRKEREIGEERELARMNRRNGGRHVPGSAMMPRGFGKNARSGKNKGAGFNQHGGSHLPAGPSNGQSRHQQPDPQPSQHHAPRGNQTGLDPQATLWDNERCRQPWETPRVPPGLGLDHSQQRQPNSGLNLHQVNANQQNQPSFQDAPRVPPGLDPPPPQQQLAFVLGHPEINGYQQTQCNQQNDRSQPQTSYPPRDDFQPPQVRNQNQNQQRLTHPVPAHQDRKQQQREEERLEHERQVEMERRQRERVEKENRKQEQLAEHETRCDSIVRRSVIKKLVTDQVLYDEGNLRNGGLKMRQKDLE
ncbi:hypothetical protein E2P81_ATG06344 [Venturia nashicola]|nr:hypothetical protein E2P81_ATG06344 [Venturia nashicola]